MNAVYAWKICIKVWHYSYVLGHFSMFMAFSDNFILLRLDEH